ncbi:pinin/SDK/memA/ protein conserved region-domain-containing protein [Powellomyces hirtus]|nr:pinin/SDK/memA/ protein conserved region-domain-containing protein [Powellomyces hirtus]
MNRFCIFRVLDAILTFPSIITQYLRTCWTIAETNTNPNNDTMTEVEKSLTPMTDEVPGGRNDSMEENKPTAKRPLEEEEGAIENDVPVRDTISGDVKRPRLSMDENLAKRSKRLFGVLNGTLQKAKRSTDRKSEAEKRREELEHKLAEKLKKEKEELSEKVKQEWEERQAALMIKRKEEDEERERKTKEFIRAQKTLVVNYLQTKTSPPILYLPKTHNAQTLDLLTAAKRALALETSRQAPTTSQSNTNSSTASNADPMDIDVRNRAASDDRPDGGRG